MKRHFDEELEVLKNRILYMGNIAEKMIDFATQGLFEENNEKITKDVFKLEKEMNHLHIEIDDNCMKLLALYQPTAVDLRSITAIMKINSELERIADHAVNISETSYYHLSKEIQEKLPIDITHMVEVAKEMLKDALNAFVKKDVELAKQISILDNEEDRLKKQAFEDMLNSIVTNPTCNARRCVELMLISRNIERIADHTTNIAEDVIFMISGKDVRHYEPM